MLNDTSSFPQWLLRAIWTTVRGDSGEFPRSGFKPIKLDQQMSVGFLTQAGEVLSTNT